MIQFYELDNRKLPLYDKIPNQEERIIIAFEVAEKLDLSFHREVFLRQAIGMVVGKTKVWEEATSINDISRAIKLAHEMLDLEEFYGHHEKSEKGEIGPCKMQKSPEVEVGTPRHWKKVKKTSKEVGRRGRNDFYKKEKRQRPGKKLINTLMLEAIEMTQEDMRDFKTTVKCVNY